MPESGKSYSDYAQHLATLMNGMLFLAGFTFTVVAILLTSLPNPEAVLSQLTFLFLTAVFYLCVFIAGFFSVEETYYCEHIPPSTRRMTIMNVLLFLALILFSLAFPLLFFLWDLTLLAAASGLMWLFFVTSAFLFIYTPFRKWRKDNSTSSKT